MKKNHNSPREKRKTSTDAIILESLIMKLERDLKDAECTLQAEVNELQRALSNSNGAERQVDRYVDQQLNVLNQALTVDRSAICHAQEVASAKACHVRQQPGGKQQRSVDRVLFPIEESLICKLEHDLKEAEQTLQNEICELQRALGQSNAAEKTSDRLAEQQVNVLNQALNCDKSTLCRTQEMSSKICNCPPGNNSGNGKFQRVIAARQDAVKGTSGTSSVPGQKGKVYIIQNNSRPQPSPSGKTHDYTQDYNVIEDSA